MVGFDTPVVESVLRAEAGSDQMNQVFGGHPSGASGYPAVNLWGNDDKLVLTAEIPGLDASDVNITVQGNQVSLEGAKKTETADEKAAYYRRERGSGQFSRSFRLPFEIDENKVAAKFADGVLSVTLPRAESAKPKRIDAKLKNGVLTLTLPKSEKALPKKIKVENAN